MGKCLLMQEPSFFGGPDRMRNLNFKSKAGRSLDKPQSSPWVDAMFTAMLGGFAGVAVTLPALVVAIASGGGGHGNYLAARFLFPYTMILWQRHGGTFDSRLMMVALVQFPILGAIFGAFWPARTTVRQAVWSVVGIVQVGACFLGLAFGAR